MLKPSMLVALPLAMILTGCPKAVESPQQAAAHAEIMGNLTVFTYFASHKKDIKNAPKYLAAIEVLETNITSKPAEGGFVSLTDLVHRKLEEKLVGENAAFLPGAKSLTRLLLLEMDTSIELPKIEPSEELKVLLDIVKAFLKGAKASLSDFIPD
jgi:hypothetical protein